MESISIRIPMCQVVRLEEVCLLSLVWCHVVLFPVTAVHPSHTSSNVFIFSSDQFLFQGSMHVPRYDVPRRSMPPVAVVTEPLYETLSHQGPQSQPLYSFSIKTSSSMTGEKVLII